MFMKVSIPQALREQVWITHFGMRFKHKCYISWCRNTITVFDFHVGHNIPRSLNGPTILENLRPICSRCNLSMSNKYSIDDWNRLGPSRSP
jgi:5-methylcytosine-specific restriction endonuclease McrA